MKTITAYETSDGVIFNDESKAERHEVWLKHYQLFDLYLDSAENQYQSHAYRKIVKNSLTNWEFWKIKNDV